MVYDVPIVSLEINGQPSCLLMMANHKMDLFMVYNEHAVSLEINCSRRQIIRWLYSWYMMYLMSV